MPSLATVTPDAEPTTVLRLAKYVTKLHRPFGALEHDDYVSIACLAFYDVAARWRGHGNFGAYVLRCMDGAVREAKRREARHLEDFQPPRRQAVPGVQGCSRSASNRSASPRSITQQHKRQASRRVHNQTYYFRHYEWYAQRDYKRYCARLGAAALPYTAWRERREAHRKGMAT